MGFLKDLRTMQKLGTEARRDWDPAAQMREATARMQQLSADATLRTSGAHAPAVVTAVRETGTVVDNQPVLEVDVTVMPAGAVPFPATGMVTGHARQGTIRSGVTISVRYDPAAPSIVAVC
jgi:hypothetical protein